MSENSMKGKRRIKRKNNFRWLADNITGYDVFDLNDHMTILWEAAIKKFQEDNITWPSYPGTEEFPTWEKWQRYLKKIHKDLRRARIGINNFVSLEKDAEWQELEDDALKRIFHIYHYLWL